MINPLLEYFTDPVLRAPTIGSILMSLSASLIGVIVYLRKESLIGEALSHATYPGVILGALFFAIFISPDSTSSYLPFFILGGAALTSFCGILTLYYLTRTLKIKNDSALCFVLSVYFGIGVLFASQMQFTHSLFYKQVQVYLWGQAATMTDRHIYIYATLSFLTLVIVASFYKEIKAATFDRAWAEALGFKVFALDLLLFILIILSIVTGIRSVGVVLMSALLIAPAVTARQFTNSLSRMFLLAAMFGALSAYFGTVLSFELSKLGSVSLPTGPLIVLVSAMLCLFSLLFAPKRGVIIRKARMLRFKMRSLSENILKTIWRLKGIKPIEMDEISSFHKHSFGVLRWQLAYLTYSGWLKNLGNGKWELTKQGSLRAQNIVRLHRLWEVYLVDYVGAPVEKVHKSAEEMEHVLTKDIEKELLLLLKNPKVDPHHQPIPPSSFFGEKL